MSVDQNIARDRGSLGDRTPLPSTALSDYLVLDLTRVRSGPTCVRQLADWGADVIKIEMPNDTSDIGGPRAGPDFQNLHRNKRSLTLNLKSEEGKKIFVRLAAKADVIVENFRPNVKQRLGIDYESLVPHNSKLIYASISGFGQDGPLANRPGFDQIAQGMGGLMSITGAQDQGPMRVGIPIADLCAGLFAAQAIFIALLERVKSGKGQWVRTSLLQAQVFMLDFQAARYLIDGDIPQQAGNNHPKYMPTGVFKTSDGHINIAVAGELIWHRLSEILGKPEWRDDKRFAINEARSENRNTLHTEIEVITKTRTSEYWVSTLNDAGVPAGDIYDIKQVFENPQVQHLNLAQPVKSHERGDTHLVGQPIDMSRTPSQISSPPPIAGGHANDILRALGYSDLEINRLKQTGII